MNDQLEELLTKFNDIALGDDGEQPRMPFPTNYQLTRLQEDNLLDYADQRLRDLESDLGRDTTRGGDWWSVGYDSTNGVKPEKTFMGKRRLYELTYQNEMEWRQHVVGGIFAHSNLIVPLARRIARQMTARGNAYFFGSDPYFAAFPVGDEDKEMAVKANKYAQHKAKESGLRATCETAVNRAFVLGECVVKTTHLVMEQPYRRMESVLIRDGQPVFAQDGDYIKEGDEWVDLGAGIVLKRDGVTPLPEVTEYAEMLINRRIREYYGPSQENIHFQDFLCPLDSKDIQTADCCVHLYDTPAMVLADRWAKRGAISLNANEKEEVTVKAIEALRGMAGGSNVDNEDSSTRDSLGETSQFIQRESMVEIAEFYIRYDADGDGIMEEIMLVYDRKNKIPIFYDYVANVTPDGKRPFSVVKINKELGYWHGQGVIEMFESTQNIVDLLVNRWNFSQTSSSRVDFWNPQATQEGSSNPHLRLNMGKTYTLKPGMKAEDALQSVVLHDVKGDHLENLMQFFLQLAMNESGVQHANDSSMVGLDSQKLATGIRNVEKTSQEMFSVYLSDLEPGLDDVLTKFNNILFAYLDPNEVVTYFNGDPSELLTIKADEIMDLDLHMNLVMTRNKGQQVIEGSMQAANLVAQYYGLHPIVQERVASMYIDAVREMGVKNPETIFAPAPVEAMAGAQANPEQVALSAQQQPREVQPNL